MLCKVCGAQIPDDAAECEFCGAKITDENNDFSDDVSEETRVIDSAEIESRLENEEPEITDEIFDDNERRRRKQMQKMMEDKKQQLSEIEKRRNEKRQKQKRNRIMLIAAICALAVAAAGVGIYYIMQNVNPKGLVDETPAPGMVTEATAEPTEEPTEEPSDELSMTTETSDNESASSNTSGTSTRSWTSTGNTGSGSSSSSGSGSSSTGGSSKTSSSSGSGSSSASSGTSSSSSQSATSASSVNVPASQAADSGKTTDKITSELATGSEVITNSDTGKLLMTFIIGGTRYYANVSEGSTTDQVQDKYYTITAEPTDETYNGNTIYEITTFTNYDGEDYVLPESGIRLLTDSDISGMSKYDLALARNEIYARHGRKFQTAEYSEYFSSKSWYSLNPNYNYSDDDSNLNDIEIKNVQFLLKAERK